MTPEEQARQRIDGMLDASGWLVQTKDKVNLSAARGIAVVELTFKTGEPDYTLLADGKAIGTIEAKPEGHSPVGVEEQSTKYKWDRLPACREKGKQPGWLFHSGGRSSSKCPGCASLSWM
jgi:type I restriction enzyme R subunit